MIAEALMLDLVVIYLVNYSRILVRDCNVPQSIRVALVLDCQLTLVHTELQNHL